MRLVILTSNDFLANLLFSGLLKKGEDFKIEKVVLSKNTIYRRSPVKLFFKILKKSGFCFVLYKVIEFEMSNFIFSIKSMFGIKKYSIKKYAKKNKIDIEMCRDVNDDDFLDRLERLEPDLLICARFNQVLGKSLLSIPRFGCINFHGAYLPKYKGLCSTFHAFYRKEKYVGYTAHFMNERIDEGKILARRTIGVRERDTLLSADINIYLNGAQMLIDYLEGVIDKKDAGVDIDNGESYYFSWPDKRDIRTFIKNGGRFYKLADFIKLFNL